MNEHPDRKAFQMEDVRELRDKVDEYQTLLKEHGDEMSDSDRVLIKTLAERQTALADSLERCAKGEDEVSVIATGGLARLIEPESETIEEVDDFLTLEGLRLIYLRNA